MRRFKQIIISLYDWWKYGNYREMGKAEALLILFDRRDYE